jgi:hypothetical protein
MSNETSRYRGTVFTGASREINRGKRLCDAGNLLSLSGESESFQKLSHSLGHRFLYCQCQDFENQIRQI